MLKRSTPAVVGVATFTAFLLLWETASGSGWVNPVLLPRPSAIFATLLDIIASGSFISPLAQTFTLFAVGYTISCVLGIAIGLAMGTSRVLYGLLEPLVEIIRPVPKPSLVPALFLFLGIGQVTKVTIVVLAAIFPVLICTLQGVRAIDPVLLDTTRTFQISRSRTLFRAIVPASLPMILAGMRVGLGLGLILVILAEMLGGDSGIGFLILDLQRSFQIREMFAWIVILAAFGGFLIVSFDYVENRLVPWRGRA